MAYYNVLFDKAVDHVVRTARLRSGLSGRARNMSFFTAEAHVCYLRELKPDAQGQQRANPARF
jgi:acyl-CoA thioester hydrolase